MYKSQTIKTHKKDRPVSQHRNMRRPVMKMKVVS